MRIQLLALTQAALLAALLAAPAASHAQDADRTGRALADRTDQSEGVVRISGTVLDQASGAPLAGARITAAGSTRGAETDRRGYFALAGLTATEGTVEVTISRMGFETLRQVISVTDGATARIEVALQPSMFTLEPMQVLIERTRMMGDPAMGVSVPGSAFHLGPQDIRQHRMAFDNVHDLLRQVPGMNVQDEEGFGLRPHIGIRGAGAERSSNVTLMEDGVLIAPAPYSAPAAYYFPVAGRMDGVEVRKGASQVRYGPRTLGGAVNLISASIPDERRWSADVSGGANAMLKTHVRAGDSGTHFGWMLEGYNLRTDGFKELQGGGDTGFDTRDALARFRLNTDRSAPRYQELELKLGISDHVSDETYLGLTESDFRATPDLRYAASQLDLMDTRHHQLQLRYFLRAGENTDLVVTAYRNAFEREWYKLQAVNGIGLSSILNNPDTHAQEFAWMRGQTSPDDALVIRSNAREYISRGVQAQAGWRVRTGAVAHDLQVGARMHYDYEDRFQQEDAFRMQEGRMVLTTAGAPGTHDNRRGEASALALFVHDEIRAGRWSLVPGVRWETVDFTRTDWEKGDAQRTEPDRVRENSVSAFIPGVGVSWEWSPRAHVFGGVHRGFGPPGPGADEATRIEESLNYELGLRVRRPAVGLDVTAFFSDYDNILGASTLATGEQGTGELFNGGAVEVYGIESAFDAELGRFVDLPVRVPVRVAYTFTRGTFLSDFQSAYGPWGTVQKGDRLPYLPEHTWSGSIGVEDGGRELTLSWNGAAAMRTEAGRGSVDRAEGADGFTVLSLQGSWDLGGPGTIYGGVQNVLDERYVVSRRPAGARPGLPRSLFLGYRVSR